MKSSQDGSATAHHSDAVCKNGARMDSTLIGKAGLTLGFRILYESDFSMKKGSVFGAKCFVSMILKGLKSIKNRQLQLFVCMRPEW